VFLDFNPDPDGLSAYSDVVAPNGQEMNPKVLGPYERQRMAENTVQYEGDYDAEATVGAPGVRTVQRWPRFFEHRNAADN
jgi:hypothetical protein